MIRFSLLLILIVAQSIIADEQIRMKRGERVLYDTNGVLTQQTDYTVSGLNHHGNYCGYEDDKEGDGSTVDACDACCKSHKKCYSKARKITVSPLPFVTAKCVTTPKLYPVIAGKRLECDDGEGPDAQCQEAVCKCDLDFVSCLQKAKDCDL